jgi:hypothetical protein
VQDLFSDTGNDDHVIMRNEQTHEVAKVKSAYLALITRATVKRMLRCAPNANMKSHSFTTSSRDVPDSNGTMALKE